MTFFGSKVESVMLVEMAQASGRSHFETASALVALFHVEVHLAGPFFVFDNGFKWTGCGDFLDRLGIRAFFGEPVLIEVHGAVHVTTCFTGHAAQRQVFEGGTKSAGWVPFNVGEVNEKRGVMDHPGQFPFLDTLKRLFVLVKVFLVRAGGGIDRAADGLLSVAACLGSGYIPVHIGDEGFAAAVLDSLHDAPHEDRVDGRIADVITGVHFDDHHLVFDALADLKIFEDQVEFCR